MAKCIPIGRYRDPRPMAQALWSFAVVALTMLCVAMCSGCAASADWMRYLPTLTVENENGSLDRTGPWANELNFERDGTNVALSWDLRDVWGYDPAVRINLESLLSLHEGFATNARYLAGQNRQSIQALAPEPEQPAPKPEGWEHTLETTLGGGGALLLLLVNRWARGTWGLRRKDTEE